ncbi:hypothetical protein C8Q78DRAFT_978137 [Trametes maxima]|nr:hypothetical protein C8Q78DRAFT_978137 [Trametes maxima]
MAKAYTHLTEEEVEFFLENGYIVVKGAFSRAKAAAFTRDMWTRLGLDPLAPETWPADKERIHMPVHLREPVASFAPRVWEIMKELLGGEERIDDASSAWGDSFIVNLGPADQRTSRAPVDPPPPAVDPRTLDNWHVDGDFFVHFLDSPEQALLTIPVFSDIRPGGGATYIAPQGVAMVARYLAAHPEGVVPKHLAFFPDTGDDDDGARTEDVPGYWSHCAAARRCTAFVELTADVGDVVLLHPLMLHSASRNALRVPRVITNPPVALREPFCFSREDPGEYSLVERATLRALGVDRFEFRRTGERRRIVPERVIRERKMREDEKRRLGLGAGPGADAKARPIAVA